MQTALTLNLIVRNNGVMKLTPRMQAEMIGLSQGLSVKQIAARLQISGPSVYRDLAEAAKRLEIAKPTMAALVARARDQGVVNPNLRLSTGGYLTMTPGAASRGERN